MRFSTRSLLSLAALTALTAAAANVEVWSADRRIDGPVEVRGRGLRIEPGVKVAFSGAGSLLVQEGTLDCRRVAFEADGVLTNRFRISVVCGRLDAQDCIFRRIQSVTPAGTTQHWIEGGICVNQGSGLRIEHCTFECCSPVMVMSSHGAEISRNLVTGGIAGFTFLRCRNARIVANEFWGMTGVAVKVGSGVVDSELFMNRFTSCETCVRLQYCADIRLSGNAFFDCATGLRLWECGKGIVENGNRYENVKKPKLEKKR